MTWGLLLSLAGLAALDTLSPTTFLVTIFVLLADHPRPARLLLVYAATVAVAYFALGLVLMLSLTAAFAVVETLAALWVQAVLGAGLLVGSFFIPARSADQVTARTRSRSLTGATMVALGLGTWMFEAATAVPYLGAVTLMSSAALPARIWAPLLAAYVIVMVAPCALLTAMWFWAGERMRPRLERWQARLSAGSRTAISWMVGIAGFLVLRDAVVRLLVAADVIKLP